MPRKPVAKAPSSRPPLVLRVTESARTALRSGHVLEAPVEIEPLHFDPVAMSHLEQERRRLVEELRRQESCDQDHPTTGNHMADDATEVSEQAKALALRRHLEGMLQEIDLAILRVQKGTYGRCVVCGGPISVERLVAMPSATSCIECAKKKPIR